LTAVHLPSAAVFTAVSLLAKTLKKIYEIMPNPNLQNSTKILLCDIKTYELHIYFFLKL